MRIDVIANTNARAYRQEPSLLSSVQKISAARAHVHPTQHVDELEAICRSIADRGTDLVVLSGGDGSFMNGVTALARVFEPRKLPRIALLPTGTVGTVARNFGLNGPPLDLLQRLLSRPDDFSTTSNMTLRVRQTLGAETSERIGFMFGTGLVARFMDIYYADGALGYPGAARIAARVFFDSFYGGPYARRVLTPMPCTIEANGTRIEGDRWSLICAAAIRKLGIGMNITYRAGEDFERVHLIASRLPPYALGPQAVLVLLGKPIQGAGHVDDLYTSFVVRFAPEGPYVLDGDNLRASEVHVSAGPPLDLVSLPG